MEVEWISLGGIRDGRLIVFPFGLPGRGTKDPGDRLLRGPVRGQHLLHPAPAVPDLAQEARRNGPEAGALRQSGGERLAN